MTLAMALLYVVLPLTWIVPGLLVAVTTSGWVKGRTTLQRLPKNILIILLWPIWIWYIVEKK